MLKKTATVIFQWNLLCRYISDPLRVVSKKNLHKWHTVQYKEDVMDLHKSFEEAKKCIRIHQNMNRGDVVILYEKIGIYKLIYLILGTEEASELLENYIYTLKSYDEKNNADLLETLIIICENSWNLKLASKELFLHYNTIKYRFSRICQILQSDFKNMDDRLNAEVAIRIYQMTK